MHPRKLKRWLILIAVLYVVFPRDLILDFLGGGLGLLDDLAVVGLLTWLYRRRVLEYSARATHESAGQDGRDGSRRERAASEGALDPYEVLGIPSSASGDAIRAAYKARMVEYHPDKVAHLGEELRGVAHRKTLEIQRAYEELRPRLDPSRRRGDARDQAENSKPS